MEEWEGKVGKGEGDAFGAGGDNTNAVTVVVGEGGAKQGSRRGPRVGPKKDGGRGR